MSKVVRIACDRDKSYAELIDVNTGKPAFINRGNDITFEVGLFSNGSPVQSSDVTGKYVWLEVKAVADPAVVALLSGNDATPGSSMTLATWRAGTAETATVSFTKAQTAPIGAGDFWLVVFVANNDAPDYTGQVTYAAAKLKVYEDGADFPTVPVVQQDGFVKRSELASGLQAVGDWDANTNTPNLTALSPEVGDFYVVTIPGTNLITGTSENWDLGDRAIYTETGWIRAAVDPSLYGPLALGVADPTIIGVAAPLNVEGYSNTTPPNFYKKVGGASTDWYKIKLSPVDWWIDVRLYGAIGDGVADDTGAIEAALLAAGEGGTVFIPKGTYRTTRTIRVYRRSVVGEFSGHVDIPASMIRCDFTSGAGFNVSGTRGTVIERLAFLGNNTAPITANDNFSAIKSDWLSPGIDNSQTTPYCGIAIDSTGEGTSFYVSIKNCSICRFAVGFAVSPFGGILGAAIDVYSCYIAFNAFNVSIGNSQNRGVRFFGGSFNHAWTCFTNVDHGTQSPLKPSAFQVFGTDCNFCYRLFNVRNSSGGAFMVHGMYSEACWSIGNLSAGNASNKKWPIFFSGCEFYLSETWTNADFLRLNSGTLVKFESCLFNSIEKVFAMNSARPMTVFRNCFWQGQVPYKIVISSLGENCFDFDQCYLDGGNPLTEINKEVFSLLVGSANQRINISRFCEKVKDTYYSTSERTLAVRNKDVEKVDIFSLSAHNWTGDTLTFNCSGVERLQAGDLLKWPLASTGEQDSDCSDIACVEVTDISGNTVTCNSLANNVDKTATPTTVFIELNYFVTKCDINGDITSGSAIVTNCTDVGLLQVGDFLKASVGFPGVGTRIISVNPGGNQFTVNQNADTTSAGVVFENHKGIREWESEPTHKIITSGIHDWAGGASTTDSISVTGLEATDVVTCTLVARAATETLILAANDAANDQIDLTLSANGTNGTTKISYQVSRKS